MMLLSLAGSFGASPLRANLPGGGTGTGPNVTVTDNKDGTVTLANGIAAIVIFKASSRLNSMTYTYNNGGTPKTTEMLAGKGQYYYGGFMLGNGHYTYSLAVDPASNGGSYADIMLVSDTDTQGRMETHFSMLRGSPGFYSTATLMHRSQDGPFGFTAWGIVTRVAPEFNWISADALRNFLIGVQPSKGVVVPNSPHEITVNLNGTQAGEFADKFIYGQDHAGERAWGWSSVGPTGSNIGTWMMTTMDFSNGGPLKRDVGAYSYDCENNSILTGEIGMGSDGNLAQGELWTKTCGPWFIYMNNVPTTVTDPTKAAQALFDDATAQADAEKKAWPYSWFKNPNYAPASGRGSVEGKIVIHDTGNPNASASALWVGLEQQPQTSTGTYDFQKWLKPYQYWTQTGPDGSFTIPNIIAGDNYTLWAYGPGAAGTFLSQNQNGSNPPLECNVPGTPFSVKVTGATTTHLGTVTWTPNRVGPTVFELGFPNRKADKFRHGEDYWSPDFSPKLGYPTPVWGGQMEFPVDFPDGLSYTVGKSRWTTDWNYVLPSLPDATGAYQPCIGTINFNLANAPASGATASLYIGAAGADTGRKADDKIKISINGVDLDTASGVTAAPDALSATGYDPAYSDDSSIHFSNHGPFSDERINFPGNLLHAGQNTVSIVMGSRGLTSYLMVDYLRLELTGYMPPAPANVTAFPGNNAVLVTWPLVPGATSYDLLRSTTPSSGFLALATGQVGPVSGSGPSIMTYTDTTAVNGTQYYYAVQSVNPTGYSIASSPSAGVTPSGTLSASASAAPQGLQVVSSGHHKVALTWTASPGTNYYSVWRTTLYPNGVGGNYPLRTIVLNDVNPDTSYTDTTPTDGKIYSYYVQAISAGGASNPSAAVTAKPLPPAPPSAPDSFTGKWTKTRDGLGITLNWSPVPGATGYVIYRSAHPKGPFNWPENFVTTLMETTYNDHNRQSKKGARNADKHLVPTNGYSYQVTAVNAGGLSPSATTDVAPQ